MIGKTMMIAAFATMAAGTAPALAQMQTPTQTMPDNSMMPGNTMSNGMDSMNPPTMSRSDSAAMKKCQGMSADAMAKSSRCTKLMKKYPNQNPQTPM